LAGDFASVNAGKTIMIISATERQAYLLFEKCLFYMESKYRNLICKGKDRPTKTKIQLKNKSIIYCLPTGLSGAGIRGFTIDLLIADEAAYINDDVFSAVTPSLAAREGARIVLLSTPFGRQGYFAKTFDDPSFTTFHVSSEECPRIKKEFLEQEKLRMTKRQYMQEYLGEFVDELMQWFPDELILKCMTLKRTGAPIDKNKNYYLGIDLARMGKDQSTFEIVEYTKDKKVVQVDSIVTERTYLFQSTKLIIELNRQYNFQKIFIDDEGIGVGVFDPLLDEETTRRKVVPINNSKRVLDRDDTQRVKLLKEDLYSNLLRMMEMGEIALLDDPEIFLSLKSVQFDYTSDKLGRSHLKIFGENTHICEGLIRAAYCVKYKPLNIWIGSF
jgi:hypothetical protein